MLNKLVLSLMELAGLLTPFDDKQQNFIVHFCTFLALADLV
jgi:hypothetical protein